jgi:hypothetical protein
LDKPLRQHFYTWLVDSQYEDPRQVFQLKDGVLRISGDGLGYIATQASFQNYHLYLEFKWGKRNWAWGDRIGKARDSGVFLHATGPDGNSHDGNGAFMSAIECNVFEGAVGDFLLIRGDDVDGNLIAPEIHAQVKGKPDNEGWPTFQLGGQSKKMSRWGRVNHRYKSPKWKDRTGFRDHGDPTVPGAWNRLECRCVGRQISIFVNGTLVNKADQVWPHQGKILIAM